MSIWCSTHANDGTADISRCPQCEVELLEATIGCLGIGSDADECAAKWMRAAQSMADDREKLSARVAELEGKLRLIGDFAHDRSQGPAIHDDLWWVREQAYDSL